MRSPRSAAAPNPSIAWVDSAEALSPAADVGTGMFRSLRAVTTPRGLAVSWIDDDAGSLRSVDVRCR